MPNIIEVENLRKVYGEFTLTDISFALPRGYIMGLIGPNGAGKSTIIKLIMNLVKRDEGKINIFGLDSIGHEVDVKQRIGFVYDDNHFYEELTVEQMKKVIAPFYNNWDAGLFHKYLKQFEISPKKKIKELSKGMKTKFSLAFALSHHAELIIMDEPTSGLDPVFRNEILEILVDLLQDENKGVIFSTHITSDLDKIADYITFINKGKLVFSKTKDEILDNYAVVKGVKELLDRDLRTEFVGVKENRYGFEALTSNVQRVKKLFGEEVMIEKATLEDIMLYTVRREKSA